LRPDVENAVADAIYLLLFACLAGALYLVTGCLGLLSEGSE